jgi:hypothetical protein
MPTMKNPEFNKEVMSKLSDFESLESISPSEEWKQSIAKRLISVKPISNSAIISTKYKVLVLIAILINVGIVWSSVMINSRTESSKSTELQLVSNEFLVNPISINN